MDKRTDAGPSQLHQILEGGGCWMESEMVYNQMKNCVVGDSVSECFLEDTSFSRNSYKSVRSENLT